MATVILEGFMPPATDFPFPTVGITSFNDPTYNLMSWRLTYDDSWIGDSTRKAVFYFHGSNAPQPLTGSFITDLYDAGYVIFQPMDFGAWNSPVYNAPTEVIGSNSPYRYGYGNVSAPAFISRFIKAAWWVQSAIEYFTGTLEGNLGHSWVDITLIGHSLGGQAIISWSAGYANEHDYGIRGILSSGATIAGLGNYTWNDVNRNINVMSHTINLIRHKAILAWADQDAFGPPDYARRVQQSIPPGKDTYVVSPGDGDHYWDTDPSYYHHMVNWTIQLAENQTILDRFGNPAIPGPAV